MGMHRRVLDRLSGWNENYDFQSSEDIELSWRAILLDLELGFCPLAIVNYRMRSGFKANYSQSLRYGMGFVKLFVDFERFGFMPGSRLGRTSQSIAVLTRAFLSAITGRSKRFEFVRTFGIFLGLILGSVRFRTFYLNIPTAVSASSNQHHPQEPIGPNT